MPWRFWSRKKEKYQKLQEKPPDYSPNKCFSMLLAAETGLLNALKEFRQHSLYERNPYKGNWQVTPGALVNIVNLNLGLLNKSLAAKTLRSDRMDWYSEMVVKYSIPYNHPDLIVRIFEDDEA